MYRNAIGKMTEKTLSKDPCQKIFSVIFPVKNVFDREDDTHTHTHTHTHKHTHRYENEAGEPVAMYRNVFDGEDDGEDLEEEEVKHAFDTHSKQYEAAQKFSKVSPLVIFYSDFKSELTFVNFLRSKRRFTRLVNTKVPCAKRRILVVS